MTNEEAKFILQSYRHSGADATEPVFAEALEHAKRDPELANRLKEETQFDAAVAAKLKNVTVPASLRSNILAGAKIVRPRIWWQSPWIAAAACFLLLASIITWQMTIRPSSDFIAYRHDMASFLTERFDRLDVESSDMVEIKHWLAKNNAPENFSWPHGLASLASLGCRVLDWKGEKITVLCCKEQGPHEMHLLVVNRSAFSRPPSADPKFTSNGRWTMASWTRGDKVYVLAGVGDSSRLRKYL